MVVPTFTLGTLFLDDLTWTTTHISHAFSVLAVETFLAGTRLRAMIAVTFNLKFLIRTAVFRSHAITVDPNVAPLTTALGSATRNTIVVMLFRGIAAFANFLGLLVFPATLGAC